MKKMTIASAILAIALVVGSAFNSSKNKQIETYGRVADNEFVLLSEHPNGVCDSDPEKFCLYDEMHAPILTDEGKYVY